MKLEHGIFTISLDFELYWGVRDKRSIEQYKGNLCGVKNAIDEMLRVFSLNDIHATWATVGFIFFNDVEELRRNFPEHLPKYLVNEFSPYQYIEASNKIDSKYHFAPEIIRTIQSHNGQEIGTHTFSHYYCLEKGQSTEDFRSDICSAIKIAKQNSLTIKSLVFPRNQYSFKYLPVLTEYGVSCYRGNESAWLYKSSNNEGENKFKRAIRLLDTYLNLSGYHTYNIQDCVCSKPFNFPSSRFLRPYSSKLSMLDKFKLKRITNAMNDAAINNKIFHLWWHPHNFGINTENNINFLENVIKHYKTLEKTHGMKSLNMGELCLLSEK